jgi:hypothetical protein
LCSPQSVPGFTERLLHLSKHCTGTGIIYCNNIQVQIPMHRPVSYSKGNHPGDMTLCVHQMQNIERLPHPPRHCTGTGIINVQNCTHHCDSAETENADTGYLHSGGSLQQKPCLHKAIGNIRKYSRSPYKSTSRMLGRSTVQYSF